MSSPRFWKLLDRIIRDNVRVSARDSKAVSNKTRVTRVIQLRKSFRDLSTIGINLDDPHQFREGHVSALVRHWEAAGHSHKTIDCAVSILRVFAAWIGKPGMIRQTRCYLADPSTFSVSYATKIDKGWKIRGVDISEKLSEIYRKYPQVAIQLELQLAYALRVSEAWKLRPHIADQGATLHAHWGTKGGRPREIPINNPYQREVLDFAKSLVSSMDGSMIPERYTERGWKKRFYTICRRYGISRRTGIVPHGLRHERANELYQELTNTLSPIRRQLGDSKPSRDIDRMARTVVAEHLGHSRHLITSAYIGSINRRHDKENS